MDVRTELPILLRLVYACKKSFALLVFGEMEKYLYRAGRIAMQVVFHIDDRPYLCFQMCLSLRSSFPAPHRQKLRMDTHDQYLFVVGTVEDANPSALRSLQVDARENHAPVPRRLLLEA